MTAGARAAKFLRNMTADIGSCRAPADMLAVAAADAGRVAAVLMDACLGARASRSRLGFPRRDVEVVNVDGRFCCRRGTADHAIARVDYERALRPYFALDRGVFVDVGAHIGKYAVLVGRRLGSRGRVIAVEPDPGNMAALARNVAANGLRNVVAVEVACSDRNGEGVLYRDPNETILHSLRGSGEPTPVRVRTLDAVLSDLGVDTVDLLKIDVEQLELEVLTGAADVLRRSRNVRIILEAGSDRPLAFLRALGFTLQRTDHSFGADGWYYVATRG